MKELINTFLWNPREGFYFDRHWDGRFSTHKAASNFYPLLARIPDETRAQLMLRRLRDPKEFWGEYVLPSISRDDPAFNDPKNPGPAVLAGHDLAADELSRLPGPEGLRLRRRRLGVRQEEPGPFS